MKLRSAEVLKLRSYRAGNLLRHLFAASPLRHPDAPALQHSRTPARQNSGFTLIEMLVYVLIIGVVLIAATSFAFEFAAARAKISAYGETDANARLAVSRVAAEIRAASGVNSITATSLSLASDDSARNPTVFTLTSGVLYVKVGTGANLPLTNSKVRISSFAVTDLSITGKTRTFQISLQADYVSDSRFYAASSAVATTAEIKKGGGFGN